MKRTVLLLTACCLLCFVSNIAWGLSLSFVDKNNNNIVLDGPPVSEDANANNILDPGEDQNDNGRIDFVKPINFFANQNFMMTGVLSRFESRSKDEIRLSPFTITALENNFTETFIFEDDFLNGPAPNVLASVFLVGGFQLAPGSQGSVRLTGFLDGAQIGNPLGFFLAPPDQFNARTSQLFNNNPLPHNLKGVLEVSLGRIGDKLVLPRSAVVEVVPEPSTLLLLGSGLAGLVVLGRKRLFKKK